MCAKTLLPALCASKLHTSLDCSRIEQGIPKILKHNFKVVLTADMFSSPFKSSLYFFLETQSSNMLDLLEPLSPGASLVWFFAPCLSGAGSKLPALEELLALEALFVAFSVVASVESFALVALEQWVGQTVGLRPWGGVTVWVWAGCK